jgi:hypothetical protein
MNIMKRRYLMQAVLVASLGALSATGYAQTNTTTDQTPGSPGAATPAAGTGTTAGGTTGATTNTMGAGAYGTTQTGTTTGMRQPMSLERLRAYEHARANCEAGPAAQRSECQSVLNRDYAGIPAPCQKLTGNALDACVHGDYPANAGMPVKPAK